jgi:uncharacterized membrane protein
LERGVRPIGLWSMLIILSSCSSPSILVRAGQVRAAVEWRASAL